MLRFNKLLFFGGLTIGEDEVLSRCSFKDIFVIDPIRYLFSHREKSNLKVTTIYLNDLSSSAKALIEEFIIDAVSAFPRVQFELSLTQRFLTLLKLEEKK